MPISIWLHKIWLICRVHKEIIFTPFKFSIGEILQFFAWSETSSARLRSLSFLPERCFFFFCFFSAVFACKSSVVPSVDAQMCSNTFRRDLEIYWLTEIKSHLLLWHCYIESNNIRVCSIIESDLHLLNIFSKEACIALIWRKLAISLAEITSQVSKLTSSAVLAIKWCGVVWLAQTCFVLGGYVCLLE